MPFFASKKKLKLIDIILVDLNRAFYCKLCRICQRKSLLPVINVLDLFVASPLWTSPSSFVLRGEKGDKPDMKQEPRHFLLVFAPKTFTIFK